MFYTSYSNEVSHFFLGDPREIYTSLCSGEPGQECCYDPSGNLIVKGVAGGSANRYAPVDFTNYHEHIEHDLIPRVFCSQMLWTYYQHRPSDDGSTYRPPPPGIHTMLKPRNKATLNCPHSEIAIYIEKKNEGKKFKYGGLKNYFRGTTFIHYSTKFASQEPVAKEMAGLLIF